jgi:glycosyltransferase involved in cell wall biosynthesis
MHTEREDLQIESAPHRYLRIAVVTETYPPEINGVAGSIARVVEGLRQRGHELQLIRPRQHRDDVAAVHPGFAEMLLRGLPIPRYPELKMGLPAKRSLMRRWSFERPDVVHLATEGPLGWSALQAARKLQLPVISEFRTNFHAYSQHYGVGWLRSPLLAYLRKFHNLCDATLTPSPDLCRELGQQRFERLHVVGRGVDTQRFDPARRSASLRAQWGVSDKDTVILCVGRLAPEKNLSLLVEAYESLRQQHAACRLVLVGDGPQRAALQARCPTAVFAGMRRGDDLATHFASADLFAFPSLTETFGNVVLEALASGLPVVAFDYAAAAQLLADQSAGRLVPLHDAERFRQAVVDLSLRPDALRAQGSEARRIALTQSWGAIVQGLETQYRNAMATPRTAPRWATA